MMGALSTLSTAVTIEAPPVQMADYVGVISQWNTVYKARASTHRRAQRYYKRKHKVLQLPLMFLTVLLGSSAIGDMLQAINTFTSDETTDAARTITLVVSGIMFGLGLLQLVLQMLQEFWNYANLSKRHFNRGLITKQFALKCESTLGRLSLNHALPVTAPFEAYETLMMTRQNMLEHETAPLEMPLHLEANEFHSQTPMMIPFQTVPTSAQPPQPPQPPQSHPGAAAGAGAGSGAAAAVAARSVVVVDFDKVLEGGGGEAPRRQQSRNRRLRSLQGAQQGHRRHASHLTLYNLVQHVRSMAQASPRRALKLISQPSHCTHNSESPSNTMDDIKMHSVHPMSRQFQEALGEWQAQANSQADILRVRSLNLQYKATTWKAARVVPAVVLQVGTSANLLHEVQVGGTATTNWWGVLLSSFVILMLLLRAGMDRLDTVLAYPARAEHADGNMRQLINFSEMITTAKLTDTMLEGDRAQQELFEGAKLEELRCERRNIREQFSTLPQLGGY